MEQFLAVILLVAWLMLAVFIVLFLLLRVRDRNKSQDLRKCVYDYDDYEEFGEAYQKQYNEWKRRK